MSTFTYPRPFVLHRSVDHTGLSGAGQVAQGVEFGDGTVALRWRGEHASTVIWSDIESVLAIHGHGGDTTVVFQDGHDRRKITTAERTAPRV